MIVNPLKTRKIVFCDWDDTIIGNLIVPVTWKDLRRVVNFFVGANMIHPDIRDADPTSLARTDTYRGKYPHLHPMPLGEGEEYCRADGEDYPLTNKLDYAFFKRRMVRMASVEGHLDHIRLFTCPLCNKLSYAWSWDNQEVEAPTHWCSGASRPSTLVPRADWTDEQLAAVQEYTEKAWIEKPLDWSRPRPAFHDPWEAERLAKRAQAKKDFPRQKFYPEESFYYVIGEDGQPELRHGLRYCSGDYISSSMYGGFRPKKEES